MSADPYKTLGVKPDASQEEIQKTYRQLAKKLHPDLNPGNKTAEEQFKEVTAAYDLLSDAEKRARFDRGEIDASGAERPRQRYYRDFAGDDAAHPYTSDAGFADFVDTDDILGMFRRGQGGGQGGTIRIRGSDVQYSMPVDFLDAVNGAKRTITLADGGALEVVIPSGTSDGQILRLRGKGRPGIGGGPPGDALIEIELRPHPTFTRQGDDIHLELPISLREAVLGGQVSVPTPTGPVTMKIPKSSNTGRVLRLRGKGVARPDGTGGDEYVTLKVVLPEQPDPELEKFLAGWEPSRPDNPRRGMEG